MASFPNYKPIYSVSKRSEPKVRTTKFGDGYEQRLVYGIPANNNPKEYALVFKVRDQGANEIESFLDARAADSASFEWIPPGESTAKKFVCASWTREFNSPNWNEINTTFRQVFEP
jgi:phage-related protein